MPEADLDVVRRLIDAMVRDDEALVGELFHPDVEWRMAQEFVETRVYRGREQVRDFLRGFRAEWDEMNPVLDSFEEHRGAIVVSGRLVGRAAASGIELEAERTWVIEVRDGLVWRWRNYINREDALAALEAEG